MNYANEIAKLDWMFEQDDAFWDQQDANVDNDVDFWCQDAELEAEIALGIEETSADRYDNLVPVVRRVQEIKAIVTSSEASSKETKKLTGTKLQKCLALYNANATREQNIATFIEDAGCTKGGATTYFYTCKKQHNAELFGD